MKTFAICFILFALPMITPAQLTVILKIEGIDKLGGKIHVSVFNSEETYNQRDVFHSFILDAKHEALNKVLELPSGSYVFSIYQDRNGNDKLDTNLIGLPKEKFGFSNYNGKNAPGGFNKHKVEITESNKTVTITLFKI